MNHYTHLVYIGRFQPMHAAHLKTLQRALRLADHVIVLVGTAFKPRTIKNPFSYEERRMMLLDCLSSEERERVSILPLRDYLYNEHQWLAQVHATVAQQVAHLQEPARIGLIGHLKDHSSYYLKTFPQWTLEDVENIDGLEATTLRQWYFGDDSNESGTPRWDMLLRTRVPLPVLDYLRAFAETRDYLLLKQEQAFTQQYRAAWADAPYPPTFFTVDAVVVCQGHVLLVKRRAQPGKGLWALPGGFVGQDERAEEAMLRELREETGIDEMRAILQTSIKDRRLFDHPERSLRGRTLTEAFLIELPWFELPKVKGGDDAEKARWFPLGDLPELEHHLYEDHLEIINGLLGVA